MIVEKTNIASKDEIQILVNLILAGIKPYVSNSLLKHAKTRSVSNSLSKFIIIRDNDRSIIGFLMYRVEKDYIVIYEIHISENQRSKGIGTMLLEELTKDMKHILALLFVHRNNTRAFNFYSKNGFKMNEVQEDERYYALSKIL